MRCEIGVNADLYLFMDRSGTVITIRLRAVCETAFSRAGTKASASRQTPPCLPFGPVFRTATETARARAAHPQSAMTRRRDSPPAWRTVPQQATDLRYDRRSSALPAATGRLETRARPD